MFWANVWCYFIGSPGNTKASAHYMNLPLEKKRKFYRSGESFKTLSDLHIYTDLVKSNQPRIQQIADKNYGKGISFILNTIYFKHLLINTFRTVYFTIYIYIYIYLSIYLSIYIYIYKKYLI